MRKKSSSGCDGKTYSVWNNYRYALRWLREWEGKGILIIMAVSVLLRVVVPLLQVALPSVTVAMLTSAYAPGKILLLISGYVIALHLFQLANQYFEDKTAGTLFLFRCVSTFDFYKKCVEVDNQFMESSQGRKKLATAKQMNLDGHRAGVETFLKSLLNLLVGILGILIYSVTVAMESFPLLIFLCAVTLILALINNWSAKMGKRFVELGVKNYDDFDYLKKVTIDNNNGKDIRMYRMREWFHNAFDKTIEERGKIIDKQRNPQVIAGWISEGICFIRDAIVYGYLIYLMAQGKLSVSVFLLSIGIVASFGGQMNGILSTIRTIQEENVIVNGFRDFMEAGVDEEEGEEAVGSAGKPHELCLENVSFRYEGEEVDAVHNLSLTIRPGEKLALVGMNGAGKTTLIKLLCGLLRPISGRITMDGRDISAMSRKEYFREFSVVFQDVFALSISLEENVACNTADKIDEGRLQGSLKKADLLERVKSLAQGSKTMINKDLDKEGISLSGGEMQKLMLARALYKDAPVVILDEPTAALDPIAESNMYEKYNDMTEGKTSIYISHRLSSTKFCDRILFMENGSIVEEGDHKTLMEAGGAYADMFRVQASYYKDQDQTVRINNDKLEEVENA